MQETVDVLNRGQFIDMLYQLVNTMSDLKQGKIFSIDGTWGYGKTYVLEELERRLSPVVNEETYDDKFYVFHYNCWQYDYYEEPVVAIISVLKDILDSYLNLISAMLETSENSLEHRINKVAKAGWETAKEILTDVAGQYVKNKIGVDIVETFQSEKMGIDNQKFKFDQMFAFKKTLDETREKLKRMSEIKTVVIVVDELDRCMPEYAVKVLERLHHLFEGIPNTIVIMAVDSKQLENSVKKIFGNAVDTGRYLRKFISFNLELGVGELQSKYVERYNYYFEKFEERDAAAEELQTLVTLCQIDIRNLNKLIEKLDIIHTLAFKGKMSESVLWFELMWGMIKYKISLPDKEGKYSDWSDDLYWLPEIDHATYGGLVNYLSRDIIEYLKKKKNIAMTHTRIIGMNSEEIMVSNDFNGEAWHILDQLLAHKKTLYMDPVNQTVDIDECKKFIEFAKILW